MSNTRRDPVPNSDWLWNPAPALSLPQQNDGLGLVSWLVPAYLVLILIGTAVFKFGPVMARGHEMSTARAVFTSVNAATLTGFPSTVGLEDFDEEGLLGPIAVLVLMVGGALFSMIGGGLCAVRVLRLPYTTGQVIAAAIASLVLATLAGATPLLSPDRRMFDSLFQAASAFTNSGLYVGRLSAPTSVRAQAVLVPLAFMGGLGLPVLMDVFDRLTGGSKRLAFHTRTVFVTSALLYVAATIVFAVLLTARSNGDSTPEAPWRETLESASALAVNARGATTPRTA